MSPRLEFTHSACSATAIVEGFSRRVSWITGPDDGFDLVAGSRGDERISVSDTLVWVTTAAKSVVTDFRALSDDQSWTTTGVYARH